MLKLENVSYRYKNASNDVVKNVSAEYESGRLYSVVGPSGSGKTTLLSIMAGLDRPKSGKVTIEGDDLSFIDLDKYRRERVSMIFQAFHLFPHLTAIENVCMPMLMNGVDQKKAAQTAVNLLESVDIDVSKHKRYPSNLSGGEQQRVAIARGLSTGAKVILADEPTGNLDVANGKTVIEILKKLTMESNYCVIIVTHNLSVADESDVVYKMSDGVLT